MFAVQFPGKWESGYFGSPGEKIALIPLHHYSKLSLPILSCEGNVRLHVNYSEASCNGQEWFNCNQERLAISPEEDHSCSAMRNQPPEVICWWCISRPIRPSSLSVIFLLRRQVQDTTFGSYTNPFLPSFPGRPGHWSLPPDPPNFTPREHQNRALGSAACGNNSIVSQDLSSPVEPALLSDYCDSDEIRPSHQNRQHFVPSSTGSRVWRVASSWLIKRSATKISTVGECKSNVSQSHPLTRLLTCRFLSRGFCREGTVCEFSHDLEASTEIPEEACLFFLQGKCAFGASCRSVSIDLKSALTLLCRFIHWDATEICGYAMSEATPESDESVEPIAEIEAPSTARLKAVLVPFTLPLQKPESTLAEGSAVDSSQKTYAQVCVDPSLSLPETPPEELKQLPLCPFAINAPECPNHYCEYLHGEPCDFCNRLCLHPYDENQRKEHREVSSH